MELKFLGYGSAYKSEYSNTSAYLIQEKKLLLIDCGEMVFSKIKNLRTYKCANTIFVMITHTHPDHVNGLSEFCFYNFFVQNKMTYIIYPDGDEDFSFRNPIATLLSVNGVDESIYRFVSDAALSSYYSSFKNVYYVPTRHMDDMDAYSIIFEEEDGCINLYTGDTNSTEIIEDIISLVSDGKFNLGRIWSEVSLYTYYKTPHLYYKKLIDAVPEEYRDKVYCMHFDHDDLFDIVKSAGMNTVGEKKKK